MPLICGAGHLSSTFGCTQGTVVVQLDKDEIRMHDDDIQMLAGRNLPGFDKLSESLVGLARQRRSGNTDSTFQTTHFAAGVVMRRVRRHIEYLLGVCSGLETSENNARLNLLAGKNRQERELLRMFMRSQMYQKHQDDNRGAREAMWHGESSLETSPVTTFHLPLDTKQRIERLCDWKSSAGVLFRIAMTGVDAVREEGGSSESNNFADSDTKAADDKSAAGQNDDGCQGDWLSLLSTEAKLPGRTNSNQSSERTLLLLRVLDTSVHLTC